MQNPAALPCRAWLRGAAIVILLAGCDAPKPGAGQLTLQNASRIVPRGETAGGRVGDFYLRNELATFIVQRPGRELALGPYGGSLIDVSLDGSFDRFGELIPTLALGRTIKIDTVEVISDGSDGKPATIEARGRDATNAYYNLEGIVPSLLSYQPDGSGVLGFDPDAPLGCEVRVRYALEPDEARLAVTYTFVNRNATRLGLPVGFIVDARAMVETFIPGSGFGNSLAASGDEEDLAAALLYDRAADLLAVVGEDVTTVIVPRSLGDTGRPRAIGAQVPSLGSALLIGARTLAAAGKEGTFTLDPDESITLRLDVLLESSLDRALARGWELIGQPLGEVTGCVRLSDGLPAAGVRVGLLGREADGAEVPITAFTTDAAGCFAGRAPPGEYRAIAGGTYRPPSALVPLTVPGSVTLELAPLGAVEVAVEVFDRVESPVASPKPCRVSLVGARPPIDHPALGGEPFDDPGGAIARQALLRDCRGHLEVVPGRYLAIVTRGPEFERLEQLIEVSSATPAAVVGRLRRVVDTAGYAASDFHVHSIYSPDSRVPETERVLSIAAEALDFWASTDHDVVTDYAPVIRRLGLEDDLATIPGAEVTTFDTGHFNAYPLPYDETRANGGTPDWAVRDDGHRPTMQELFDSIHQQGALVQVNHPRSGGTALGAYFSRAAMTFDPLTRQPYGDPGAQPLANAYLRYPTEVVYFSADFDVLEVMNGISTYTRGAMAYDRDVESVGHDWMNFLSGGRRVVAVANSDTHTTGDPPGNPRTLVGGHDGGVPGLVAALSRGDVILTTGPMLRVTLENEAGQLAGLGDLLPARGRRATLRVHVESPTWFWADQVEVRANVWFPDPTLGGEAPALVPAFPLALVEVPRGNGGRAYVGAAELELDLGASPFSFADSWLVVLVGGASSVVFPVMQGGGGTVNLAGATPDEFLTNRSGVRPFAISNPIFIDGDDDGRWAPPLDGEVMSP